VPPSNTADTICAIATGSGGGIGIVRLSGPRAEAIVAEVVRPWPKSRPPSHKLHYGHARDPRSGAVLDEVLAVVMRAPRSFTGEDVAEIHGHGGARVLERLLELVVASGARLAEPGEFTRRAFEAGRIDLTRAEAVAELIAAKSDRALAAAQALVGGALEKEIRGLRSQLVKALAELEGALDFPDERLETAPEREIADALDRLAARLKALAGTYRRLIREGAEVALLGRANAGKSSLFNALLGEERALVDAEPGTTRDLVEAGLELSGVRLRLIDTAGERFGDTEEAGAPAGEIERRGLELAHRRRDRADALILVVDATVGIQAGERALWEAMAGVPRVLVWNKRDLGPAPAGLPEGAHAIETAAPSGVGLDALRRELASALGASEPESGALSVGERHRAALLDGASALERASLALHSGEPAELAAIEARQALHHLGRVTGETVDAEVLDAIFARFCIGK
jgi:tRNA modification GTPase